MTKKRGFVRGLVVLASLAVGAVTIVEAQQNGQLGGFGNDVQQPVGAALDGVCQRLLDVIISEQPLTDEQDDLFEVCNAMQGIPSEDIPAALQQVGTEEMAAQGTNATETSRGRALLKRLAALRSGAGGISVSGLKLGFDGKLLDAGALMHARSASVTPGVIARGSTFEPAFRSFAAEGAPPAGGATSTEVLFPDERWGLFVNGMISFGDKDATEREDGFDFQIPGITLGVDYRLGNDFILGGAVSYELFDGDFDTTVTVAGGALQSELLSASLYTTWYSDRFYVDGLASYGQSDLEMDRRIVLPGDSRVAQAETEGDQSELTVAWGYSGHRGGFDFGPTLRVSWTRVDMDEYVETNASGLELEMAEQSIESLVSILGGRFSWTHSMDRSVVIPQLRVEWNHEFDDDSRALTARSAAGS